MKRQCLVALWPYKRAPYSYTEYCMRALLHAMYHSGVAECMLCIQPAVHGIDSFAEGDPHGRQAADLAKLAIATFLIRHHTAVREGIYVRDPLCFPS